MQGCSAALTISRREPQRTALAMAWAFASVPPLVKMTCSGRTPTRAATAARPRSARSRARRPAACTDEALPPTSIAAITAALASGRIGAVAL
jgi:hypothetical protein